MRKLILFFSFALFFACGRSIDSVETNSGNILENLTYSVDTVVVDPGDDVLNLKDLSEFGIIQAEAAKLHTQINDYDFSWNEQTQQYFRFASIGLPRANVDSPKKYEHFLFVYDKELTLKGEAKLDNLEKIPRAGFFTDGKLYSYANVEDELGFAVFTFNF